MLRPTSTRAAAGWPCGAWRLRVATDKRPDGPDAAGSGAQDGGPDALDQRRRALEAALAAKRPETGQGAEASRSGGMTGFGNALRLSSEFIAGIAVGAALGWFVDRFAGTSPWGLIVFLLLGFAAGVLNVLRSAGLVAENGLRRDGGGGRQGE